MNCSLPCNCLFHLAGEAVLLEVLEQQQLLSERVRRELQLVSGCIWRPQPAAARPAACRLEHPRGNHVCQKPCRCCTLRGMLHRHAAVMQACGTNPQWKRPCPFSEAHRQQFTYFAKIVNVRTNKTCLLTGTEHTHPHSRTQQCNMRYSTGLGFPCCRASSTGSRSGASAISWQPPTQAML